MGSEPWQPTRGMFLMGRSCSPLATYILTFADGRDDVELVADMYREDPPFIEFIAFPPAINLALSPVTSTLRS